MKKIIISILAVGVLLSSCTDNGKKAETSEAQKVEVVQTASTMEFKSIKEGSHLTWKASHLGGVNPRFGKISVKDAKISINDGKVSNASFSIDLASLTVESIEDKKMSDKLTAHLKNEDFFNIAKYPVAKFELTSVEANQGDFNAKVSGNLTIMEISKSITFAANIAISEEGVSIQSENFAVDRKDWGLTYHVEGTEGVPADYLIADDIGFGINVTLGK